MNENETNERVSLRLQCVVSHAEAKAVKAIAQERGQSVSNLIRAALRAVYGVDLPELLVGVRSDSDAGSQTPQARYMRRRRAKSK